MVNGKYVQWDETTKLSDLPLFSLEISDLISNETDLIASIR